MKSRWREIAAPIITEVIKEAKEQGLNYHAAKLKISAAYPFGERHYHPYKIWLDEVRKQLVEAFPESRPKPKLEMNRASNWQQSLLPETSQ